MTQDNLIHHVKHVEIVDPNMWTGEGPPVFPEAHPLRP